MVELILKDNFIPTPLTPGGDWGGVGNKWRSYDYYQTIASEGARSGGARRNVCPHRVAQSEVYDAESLYWNSQIKTPKELY